jgi:hypothetical protein
VLDFTKELISHLVHPGISVSTLTEILLHLASSLRTKEASEAEDAALLNWLIQGSLRTTRLMGLGKEANSYSLGRSLVDPDQSADWWHLDAGAHCFGLSDAVEAWESLSVGIKDNLKSLSRLLTACPLGKQTDYFKAMSENVPVIFKLPSMHASTSGSLESAAGGVAMTIIKGWMAAGLGKPLETMDAILEPTQNRKSQLITLLMVDLLWQRIPRGTSVMWAQARSLGMAMTHVGSQLCWTHSERSNEIKASWANINTKVVYGPLQNPPEGMAKGWEPLEEGQARVVSGEESVVVAR